jgi:putative DNA primase/helicase
VLDIWERAVDQTIREALPAVPSNKAQPSSALPDAGRERRVAFLDNRHSPVRKALNLSFEALGQLCRKVKVGEKDGSAWMPADIGPGPRRAERVASLTFLVLDIEAKAESVKGDSGQPLRDGHGDVVKRAVGPEPPNIADLVAEIATLGWRAFVHTSYSHTSEHPRYRLVLDLDRSLQPSELKAMGLHVAAQLGLSEVVDATCLESARLYYLPRVRAERIGDFEYHEANGEPLAVDELLAEAALIKAALDSALTRVAQRGGVIQQFNEAHDVGAILEANGYALKGRNRWLFPRSTTGTAGVRLLPNSDPPRIFSSHDGDPLADGHAHDAFDVFRILEHAGDMRAAVRRAAAVLGVEGGDSLQTRDEVQAALLATATESYAALAFATANTGRLIYCGPLGGWHIFDGSRWCRDDTRLVYHYINQQARGTALSLGRDSRAILKASFSTGVEKIAAADPLFARSVDQFDRHPGLLATPGITIDLHTGEVGKADPEHMITRCAGVAPELGVPARWITFLMWAFDGDTERIEWLRDYLGYCLTGYIGLEEFLYLDGPGGNGKGVIGTAMRCVMGDYYQQAPGQLLLFSSLPQHSTSLANLRGARLVVASELPVGARLDEQKLKSLTGGDPITARLMRQDDSEFIPELKLIIASNHRPRIVRPDEAMRRRLRVLTMPKVVEAPDPAFKHRVIPEEAPRILHWLLEGAQRVLARGERLHTPASVKADSEAYLGSQDSFGTFLADACTLGPELRCKRADAYRAYTGWCRENGETYTMTAREFKAEVEQRGFRVRIISGIEYLQGIRAGEIFL